jgi:hypothetical protein
VVRRREATSGSARGAARRRRWRRYVRRDAWRGSPLFRPARRSHTPSAGRTRAGSGGARRRLDLAEGRTVDPRKSTSSHAPEIECGFQNSEVANGADEVLVGFASRLAVPHVPRHRDPGAQLRGSAFGKQDTHEDDVDIVSGGERAPARK